MLASPIPVDIAAEQTVGDLKDKIKDNNMYQFPAKELELYLAWKYRVMADTWQTLIWKAFPNLPLYVKDESNQKSFEVLL